VVSMFRAAFPDLHIAIDALVAEGDKVCARSTLRGTHRGEIFGIAGTGKGVTMTSLTMVRIRDGRLTESWVENDVTALVSQLAAPAAAQ
jgi:predicted ester cyclase